jgi:hypothetical protein
MMVLIGINGVSVKGLASVECASMIKLSSCVNQQHLPLFATARLLR